MSSTIERPLNTLGGKYLTFFLAGEEYGVEILRVQEIISMMPVTRVPRTPPYIRGVINLRGKVIPIMDLREKFGMPASTEPEQVMIVVQVGGVQIGVVADKVSEVASIASEDIDPTQDLPFRAQDHDSPFSITRYIQVPLVVVTHSIKTMVGKFLEQSFRGKRAVFLDLKPPDLALLGFVDR
jgi:purine-binding chemotaxis protein CheW